MASTYSPAVVPTESDFSDYAIRSSTTILAVVGYATKGPVDTPTLINSEEELVSVFGLPQVYTDGSGISYSKNIITDAIQYLREGNQLYVVRVVGSAATKAVGNVEVGADQDWLTFTAVNEGTWANSYSLVTSAPTNGDSANYFDLSITNASGAVEVYQNLAGPTAYTTDTTNSPENRINGISALFTVTEAEITSGTVNPETQTVTGGTDSLPIQVDYTNGINLMRDQERYDVNLIAIPQAANPIEGQTFDTAADPRAAYKAIMNAAIIMCEKRGDCMVIMDPFAPDVLGPNVTPTLAKGDLIDGTNYDFDSSQAALYGPWLQVYDGYNRQNVWVGPSCMIAGQYSYNDRVSQAWFAPAGLNRGKLRLASDVSVVFDRDDLEALQAPRMITNPIRPIINEGITIWGQRTAQRKATALNRVSARRMLNSAKSTIARATRVLLFEPNDSFTWSRFVNLVTPVMQFIKDTRGVYDFRVICDESTNPPAQIDQNIMRGKILLKPTKTAETIYVDFSILNTGANFDEFV